MKIDLQLLAEIRQLHSDIQDAARTSLAKAIRIGGLLSEIKAGLQHGEWLPWLEANAPFSERTARNYIQCHNERDRLKSASVADLSGAYLLLAEPKKDTLTPAEQARLAELEIRIERGIEMIESGLEASVRDCKPGDPWLERLNKDCYFKEFPEQKGTAFKDKNQIIRDIIVSRRFDRGRAISRLELLILDSLAERGAKIGDHHE